MLVVWMGLVAALLGAWRGEEDSPVGSSRLEKEKRRKRIMLVYHKAEQLVPQIATWQIVS